ncbi:PIF1-like helicase [Medicago truncatula]|uniref:PIF1-like helicase n=1 Tax=Medicago truncatula TaxID=3880 RepID=A0A072VK58_MEDTR|nr:PIF1-like helicase [Medicago truncatula]
MNDHEFAQFIMRIGDSVEPTKPNDMVRMPPQIALPWEAEKSIQTLIDHIFPQLYLHGWDAPYTIERAIITSTNDDVQNLNDIIINIPGDEHILLSFDEVEEDTHNLYQHEFLNLVAQGSIPPHVLKVKKALSIGVSKNSTKVLIKKGKIEGEDEILPKI